MQEQVQTVLKLWALYMNPWGKFKSHVTDFGGRRIHFDIGIGDQHKIPAGRKKQLLLDRQTRGIGNPEIRPLQPAQNLLRLRQ